MWSKPKTKTKNIVSFSLDIEIIRNLYTFAHTDYSNKLNMSVLIEEAIIDFLDKQKNKKTLLSTEELMEVK